MTLSAVSTTLDNVGSQLQVVNTSYDKIASTAPALLRNISESQQLLESAQQVKPTLRNCSVLGVAIATHEIVFYSGFPYMSMTAQDERERPGYKGQLSR